MADSPLVQRVRTLVQPIASDLQLDVYDVEQRGATMRVTLDTPAGSQGGVDLDQLALATRLISRELDHTDPVPGTYTLEVTSPGVERSLRTPEHFRREIGKPVSVRLANVGADHRRLEGTLVAADETTATVRVTDDDRADAGITDVVVAIADIDRARTVFEWGPQPKPGGKGAGKKKKSAERVASGAATASTPSEKESS